MRVLLVALVPGLIAGATTGAAMATAVAVTTCTVDGNDVEFTDATSGFQLLCCTATEGEASGFQLRCCAAAMTDASGFQLRCCGTAGDTSADADADDGVNPRSGASAKRGVEGATVGVPAPVLRGMETTMLPPPAGCGGCTTA